RQSCVVPRPSSSFPTRRSSDLVQLPNAGDLVLFGAYDPISDVCVCFDDQVGAHGALGGRQFWPFILSEPGLIPDDYRIEDPLDLFPLFDRYRQAARRSVEPDAADDAAPVPAVGDD